jgi:hypothetical protein
VLLSELSPWARLAYAPTDRALIYMWGPGADATDVG